MKEAMTGILIALAISFILWLVNFAKNLVKKWFHENISNPIKSIRDDVTFLKTETTIVQGYLMERNGFGNYRKQVIDSMVQDQTLENLTKEK